jgi:hypothetical protein
MVMHMMDYGQLHWQLEGHKQNLKQSIQTQAYKTFNTGILFGVNYLEIL